MPNKEYVEIAKSLKLLEHFADRLKVAAAKASDKEEKAAYKQLHGDVIDGLVLIKAAVLFVETENLQKQKKGGAFTIAELMKNTGITLNK